MCQKHAALAPVRASIDLMVECMTAQRKIKLKHYRRAQAHVRRELAARRG